MNNKLLAKKPPRQKYGQTDFSSPFEKELLNRYLVSTVHPKWSEHGKSFLDALASLGSVMTVSGSPIFGEISDQWISNLKYKL